MSKAINQKEEMAMMIVHQYGRVTRKMLMDTMKINKTRAWETLDRLTDRGFLERHETGKNIYYILRTKSVKFT